MACAVFEQGDRGIVLPALALLVYVAVERDASALRRLHWVPGLAVFGAIVLPWFVLVPAEEPGVFPFLFHPRASRALPVCRTTTGPAHGGTSFRC